MREEKKRLKEEILPTSKESLKEKKLKKEVSAIFQRPSEGAVFLLSSVEKKKRPKAKVTRKGKRQGSILGIDIGSSKVALVELRENCVLAFGFKEIDSTLSPDEGNIAVRQAIKNIIDAEGIKTKRASIVVSSTEMLSRVLEYPKMPPDELKQIVKRESEKFLPPTLREGIFDVSSIETKGGGSKLGYITFFASGSLINSIVAAVEQIGLHPVSVTGGEFILKEKFGQEIKDIGAVVDIGAKITTVVIINDGVFRFSRYISCGGDNFTQAVSLGLDTGFKHAEELKRAEGSLSSSSRLFEYLKPEADRLAEEIRITLNYHNQKFRGETVKMIGLTGGGSQLDSIDTYLSQALGIKVVKLDPSGGLDVSILERQKKGGIFKSWLPRLTMAIGAGQCFPFSINLLAKRVEKERIQAKQKKLVVASLVGAILLLLVTHIPFMLKSINLSSQLRLKENRLEGVKPLASQADELERINTHLKKQIEYIRNYEHKSVKDWGSIFRGISRTIPDNIWINNIAFLRENSAYLLIQGSALDEAEITQWRLTLEEMSYIERVELGKIENREISGKKITDFDFRCRLAIGDRNE